MLNDSNTMIQELMRCLLQKGNRKWFIPKIVSKNFQKSIYKYSQLRLIEPPVNRFLRLIGSKQPGPEEALLSGVDCMSNNIYCSSAF